MEYLKLPTILFAIDDNIMFDIYIKQDSDFVLYSTAINIKKDHLLKLNDNGIDFVYVKSSDKYKYAEYLEINLPLILNDPTIEIKQKGEIIYQHSVDLVDRLFQHSETEKLNNAQYQQISNLVDNIFKFISTTNNGLQTLQKLISNSYYDYVHSINTSIYAMSLFLHDSILNNDITPRKSEVKQLGIAAILHDIGKSKWPKELLTKQDLTQSDLIEIQKHPIYGIELCNLMKLDNIITNVVLFHHEKLDGSGYPCGTKNMNKHARIVSICDIFAAMTCDRPYRKKYTAFETLKHLKLESENGRIDANLTMTFIKLISTNQFKI